VVREGGYALTVADLEEALDEAGLPVDRGEAPAVMALPGRLLGAIAGPGVRALVPDRLAQLTGHGLEIDVYPSDIAIAGQSLLVNRARAAMASRLASTAAFLTTSAESQAIEERLERLARAAEPGSAADAELAAIDRLLAGVKVPYEEWEVLYRIRLQVERDLLSGIKPGHDFPGAKGTALHRDTAAVRDTSPVEMAFATASIGLVLLDVVLALRERFGR
jgi:hypothetical protein